MMPFAPRALLVRPTIFVSLTPSELHKLIRAYEAEAEQAIAHGLDGGAYQRRHGGPVALWSREFRHRHAIPPGERSPWDGTTEAEASPR